MYRILELLNNEANHEARKLVPRKLVESSFFFVLASIAGMKRKQFRSSNGKMQYANFFGISMAGSGVGKDTALKAAERMFIRYIDQYPTKVKDNFNSLNTIIPSGERPGEEVDYIPPTKYKFPLRGSLEGMMRAANFYNRTDVGSLNVVSTEFGNEFNPEVIPILTTLWQDAYADGSTNVNEKYPPVNDVPTNVLLFGSSVVFTKNEKKHAYLAENIESGFGRRCQFAWVESPNIELYDEPSEINELQDYAQQVVTFIMQPEVIEMSNEAKEKINQEMEELKDIYNKSKTEWNSIKLASIDKIERMAALVAIATLSREIGSDHVQIAIDMNERSFTDMRKMVMPHQSYAQMFDLIKQSDNGLSQTELIDYGIRFKTKADWEFQKELLKDLAYRKNMILKERGPKVLLREFDVNKLNKMIISTAVNIVKNPKKETNFKPQEVGFFGPGMTVEALITSNIQSFCLAHFEESRTAPEGHRKKDNFIQGQNMIAFDIDEGLTLREAIQKLTNYKYIIYTTKSHQREKNGIVCDRFRIILPTKTNFFVNVEQHKQLYENLSQVLELPTYDVATRNVSRLWFTNKNAEVISKTDGDILDVRCCIPETEAAEHIIPNLENIDLDEQDRRIGGMIKYTLINGIAGERNDKLFRLAKFVHELGGDLNDVVHRTNNMLVDPLPENEVNVIIRNIR